MPKADKKIFSLNGTSFTLVKGKRWYLEYYKTSRGIPERVRVYGANRIKDAAQREMAFMAIAQNVLAPSQPDVVHGSCPLTEALERSRPAMRRKTWQSMKARLKYYLLWLDGRDVRRVSGNDASVFIGYLQHQGKRAATVVSYKIGLASLYKKAGLANPFAHAPVPHLASRSLMYFSPAQAAELMATIERSHAQLAVAAKMLFYCFIRPAEMRLLRVDCINWQHGTITVPAGISKNKKTGTVVVPDAFLAALKHYVGAAPGGYYVFGAAQEPGPQPLGLNYFNRHHAKALAACQIKGRYAFYSWKHTGAVMAVKAGINLKDLQLQLRHHSLDMVNEYLKDLGVMDSRELREKFPAIMG